MSMAALLTAWAACSAATVHGAEEPALETVFAAAVRKVAPSVVSIRVEWKPGKETVLASGGLRPFKRGVGPVTGVIVGADGLVVTSDFNVTSDAKSVKVRLADGREFEAKVLGRDFSRGLQLLQIDVKDLPAPRFAESAGMKVGRWALTCGVGEDSSGLALSVGIVSATERIAGRVMQLDASTNPSNYGGPVVDVEGNVMGIITTLMPAGSNEGILLYDSGVGFAVPAADVLKTLGKLHLGEDIHPVFLGIRFDARKMAGGAAVIEVLRDTGAATAGIRPRDVIIQFNSEPIDTSFKLLHAIGRCHVDDVVRFKVIRDGKELELTATLGARPERPR
jgi:serine protease Do